MCVIGMGSDIVECLRIAQMIDRHGEVFLRRVYTSREIEYCSSRSSSTQHYAARWAAKKAVLRALGAPLAGTRNWRDIEIRTRPEGHARVALAGEARDVCISQGVHNVQVCMAFCRTHATAYALALGANDASPA